MSQKIVLASNNLGKVREIGDLLRPYAVEVVSAGALGLAEPEETGTTLIANAQLKARAAALQPDQWSQFTRDMSSLVTHNCFEPIPTCSVYVFWSRTARPFRS